MHDGVHLMAGFSGSARVQKHTCSICRTESQSFLGARASHRLKKRTSGRPFLVHLPPKAEVTGSNPVGRANNFNGLTDKSFARLFA